VGRRRRVDVDPRGLRALGNHHHRDDGSLRDSSRERPGQTRAESEREFFKAYAKTFAGFPTTMLVDTYDTERGIRHAVEACPNDTLGAIRIDSNVTPEAMRKARKLLVELGSPSTKIYVSDGLDEQRVAELRELVDGFGVGETLVCSPDAATGIGAVAKLIVNGYGATTMKVAHGTGKATLPGELQVWRFVDHDLVALATEPSPGGGARPILIPVWRGDAKVHETKARDDLAAARERCKSEIEALPAVQRSRKAALVGEARERLRSTS
jgi:nicotinate phosphoribosyltransferase